MRKQLHVGAFAILACLSNAAVAQVIDFEPDGSGKLPDGVTDAADDIPITDEFASVGGLGITFGIDADRIPIRRR